MSLQMRVADIRPNERFQIIDVTKLPAHLGCFQDNPAEGGAHGHATIVPLALDGSVAQAELESWAASKATEDVHPLTQSVLTAIIGEDRRPK